jgi:tRNA nucleotidyltransferase (CCA-adding enzyme)
MQSYVVGGWVRDELLGRDHAAGDRDWVVVGATPDEMIAQGFKPVGRDFPVFLHPQTREEYALARTERKTAPGYRGFVVHAAPDVTLEQDLARRDLTINAMAIDGSGRVIDPFGGRRDLQQRVLRHVGPAFVEDPVRILRLARFAARFPEFSVAPETLALARSMVERGEADALVPERVWQELSRGLMERRPSRMIEVLDACGLPARLFPELRSPLAAGAALDAAAQRGLPLAARFAVMASAAVSADALVALLAKLRADADSAAMARLLRELRAPLRDAHGAPAMLSALERGDALRRPQRFEILLDALEALDGLETRRWRTALAAAAGVDAGSIAAKAGAQPDAIATAIAEARRAAIAASEAAGRR